MPHFAGISMLPFHPQKDELTFWMGAKLDANLLKNIQKKIAKNIPNLIESSPKSTTDIQGTSDEGGGENDCSPQSPRA